MDQWGGGGPTTIGTVQQTPKGLLIEPILRGPKSGLAPGAALSATRYQCFLRVQNRTGKALQTLWLVDVKIELKDHFVQTVGKRYKLGGLQPNGLCEVGGFPVLFPSPGLYWFSCRVVPDIGLETLQVGLGGQIGRGWSRSDDPQVWTAPVTVIDKGLELQVVLNRWVAALTAAVLLLTIAGLWLTAFSEETQLLRQILDALKERCP